MWHLSNLVQHTKETLSEYEPGKWEPAKPLDGRSFRDRVREAWLVFTGTADCFLWPEQSRKWLELNKGKK